MKFKVGSRACRECLFTSRSWLDVSGVRVWYSLPPVACTRGSPSRRRSRCRFCGFKLICDEVKTLVADFIRVHGGLKVDNVFQG